MTLWILEDDAELGLLYSELMTRSGQRFKLLTHLHEARELSAQAAVDPLLRPRAVISDLRLPDGLSTEWLVQLRGLLPDTPILCMSGLWAPADRARLRALAITTEDKATDVTGVVQSFLRGLG